ncbi:unnamed protein product [Urochloa decumbens]|uniref:F-box domain-containing protein n=1 Tax=Urochloa decumbens TaxID=240449 RepID=A0ABC9FY18_9POAL
MAAASPVRDDGQPALADSLVALDDNGALPADVLYEILLRVPAKPLCRLRLVCRSWRSLTSDPRFAGAHSSRHPMIAGLCAHGIQGEIQIVDLRSGNIDKRIYGFGLELRDLDFTTQGDLICASSVIMKGWKRDCIIDPTMGSTTILPTSGMDAYFSVCILGHVPSTWEYKVLRVGAFIPSTNRRPCQIITLIGGAQRWRARSDPSLPVSIHRHTPVVAGVVYFLLDRFSVRDFPNAKNDDIVAFDLATEEWRSATIQGPFSTCLVNANGEIAHSPTMDYLELAKLNNFLVTIHHNEQDHSMDIWFLVDMDKSHWTKRYAIPCLPRWNCHMCTPLVILNDGRIVLHFEGIRVLQAYDPRIDTCARLTMPEDYFAVSLYEGSLLLRSVFMGT